MREMLPLADAQQLILSRLSTVGTEEVELLDAQGRVLAEEIVARDSLPPFCRSAMDGYAVRAADTESKQQVTLTVVEELPAGKVAARTVEPGTCIMLMTGAPLPEGADSVVKREDVKRNGDEVVVPGNIAPGTNVDQAGSDMRQGDLLLHPGTVLGPGEVAILASQGYGTVKVYRRPKVAVLTTGDELLDISEPLVPGKIRNSNRYMLAAAVKELGGEPLIYPSMPDELEATREMLLRAGKEADLVLSTGGVSMGDYDLVREALLKIADEALFWKLQIKPGMPVVSVIGNGTLYLGLSGKPNGALLNFNLLARPAIAKLSGKNTYFSSRIKAVLENDFPKASKGRNRYLYACACFDGVWKVRRITGGHLSSLKGFNAFIEIPAGSGPLQAGEEVDVILLDNLEKESV